MAAAAERAALESLEQSEAVEPDPVEAEADRRVAEAASAFEGEAPSSDAGEAEPEAEAPAIDEPPPISLRSRTG